ncbi:NAD(+) synthase [[Mycoplasma] falconis]|uniref:NH(3)-dependent NAD(+) synthetase n=1 Tax=[Mycoplasma] falconis TaxID=92403 RepID=A0A501XAN4_9BACT|nr:NAD(+) synthase [[Mycoplasma] falconis]TPE57427.1 NAD(+) synthase [[Mycoplasma] falconis]
MNNNDFKKTILTNKELKIYQILIKKIRNWLRQKVNSAKANGIALGISGGIDSATLAKICDEEFQEKAHFYYFKTKQDTYTEDHINQLQKVLKNKIEIIDLTNEYKLIINNLKLEKRIAKINTKSRLFMTSIYALSQDKNCLVLGTDNYDEFYLGYFTKYGDGGCDLLPFANIKKSDVYAMANILNIPKSIIDKKPSANLEEEQYDEDELGFSYDQFEKWLIDKNSVSKEVQSKIEKAHKLTDHKRDRIPVGPKLK